MAEAQQDYTLTQVQGNKAKLDVDGFEQVVDVVPPKGESLPPLADGQQVRGWYNAQGKFGPYLKLAGERSSNGSSRPQSGGRSDTTGRSIERQVAAKIAGDLIGHEGYAALQDDTFALEFRQVTDAVHAAIVGTDDSLPF